MFKIISKFPNGGGGEQGGGGANKIKFRVEGVQEHFPSYTMWFSIIILNFRKEFGVAITTANYNIIRSAMNSSEILSFTEDLGQILHTWL